MILSRSFLLVVINSIGIFSFNRFCRKLVLIRGVVCFCKCFSMFASGTSMEKYLAKSLMGVSSWRLYVKNSIFLIFSILVISRCSLNVNKRTSRCCLLLLIIALSCVPCDEIDGFNCISRVDVDGRGWFPSTIVNNFFNVIDNLGLAVLLMNCTCFAQVRCKNSQSC